MKRLCLLAVCFAGCSSAPVADTLDWLRPGYSSPERPRDYENTAPPPRRPSPVPDAVTPAPRDPLDRPTDPELPPLAPPPGV